jgi:hypothetical protein
MGFSLSDAWKTVTKPVKKVVREVSKAPKVVGKTVDKATGGNISKGLKKTGLDKAGQAIIDTAPQRVAARMVQGDNLGDIGKDYVKGSVIKSIASTGPVGTAAAGKMAKGKSGEGEGEGDMATPKGELGAGFEQGLSYADKVLGPEGLRTQTMRDVMGKRLQQANEGMSAQEREAMKSRVANQMMRAEAEAGLKLGSALGGMRGASAAAQARSLQAQGMQARAGIERDIFLANEQAKRAGIDALEATGRFDVSQIGKEKEFRATTGLALEGIQAQREGAFQAAQATRDAAPQQQNFFQSLPIIGDWF